METRNTLKEYYINIQKLYQDAVNMLTAINQSLVTTSSEVNVTVYNTGNSSSTMRLPSFLYLENKVEQLSNTIDNLFNMPQSGEAWFNNSGGMYKLKMVKSNTAPLTPILNTNNIFASSTDNNILRDLVSPKTYLKINVDNLPDNIEKMFMRKFIIYSSNIFNNQLIQSAKTYDEFNAAIYGLQKGIDYDVYDSTIDLPIKNDVYNSAFNIISIPTMDLNNNIIENPFIDTTNNNHKHYTYTVELDTLIYTNSEDSSITYTLKPGDFVCLGNQYVIYKIKEVYINSSRVVIEEQLGHIALQDISANSDMTLQIYNEDYSNYHYVNIPLEENPYICVFLGNIMGNTRSILSAPILVDLNNIMMYDNYGNPIIDSYGAQYNYISYYEKYCKNIGDLILGLTNAAYPQLSNFTPGELNSMQNDEDIRQYVSETINDTVLKVVPINKHLIDDTSIENIINLHTQKSELNAELTTVNDNISNVYNQLITTDFSQEITITQTSLKSKLDTYYNKKTNLQTQLNTLVNEISIKSSDVTLGLDETKYRIRGISDIENIETYLHSKFGSKCDIIGIDIEYKYKSSTSDTTKLTTINSDTFTDWNKQTNIDRQRELEFNSLTTSFNIEYSKYISTDNIIKWNQFDIPIKQGEEVIIRIRYKYNVGQPFINIYTPWSDELTIVFPSEYEENVELKSIIETNKDDAINAAFNTTLIIDGYQDHVNNKLIDGSQTFYHMPENIYSGFNTPENSLISLKDKLQNMVNDIDKYKSLIEAELNTKYSVYLNYNDTTIELNRNSSNNINLYNIKHITDNFVKEDMNIIIKNTGSTPIKLYSIFPGNTSIPLLLTSDSFYNKYIYKYERVPLIENNKWGVQTLGQWIYFRDSNIWTNAKYYLDNIEQRNNDKNIVTNSTSDNPVLSFDSKLSDYINKNNKQPLYGYRYRYIDCMEKITTNNNSHNWCTISKNNDGDLNFNDTNNSVEVSTNSTLNIDSFVEELNEKYGKQNIDMFKYWPLIDNKYSEPIDDQNANKFVLRYEDFVGIKKNSQKIVKLDIDTVISKFLTNNNVAGIQDTTDMIGAFLYPNISTHKQIVTDGTENGYTVIEVGSSISIPIAFEYYLPIINNNINSLTKTLSFDLRPSLYRSEDNYIISITANVDNTATGEIYATDILLTDNATI